MNLVDFLLEIATDSAKRSAYQENPLVYVERSGLSNDDKAIIKAARSVDDINEQIADDPRADSIEIMHVDSAPGVFVDVRLK